MLPPLSLFSFLIFSMLTALGLFKLYSKILILDIFLLKKSKFRVKEGGLATAFEKWETRSFRSEEFS